MASEVPETAPDEPELEQPEAPSPQSRSDENNNASSSSGHDTNDNTNTEPMIQHIGDVDHLDFGDGNDDSNNMIRLGTTSSARFNILSTMVGGGSLSLPFAFAKSGNALVGPLFLIVIAFLSEYCFRIMVHAIRTTSYPNANLAATTKAGNDSFESMAAAAFGPRANVFSMFLVTSMCFFGTVGYAVLLRDMLEPITVAFFGPQDPGPSWANNSTLWMVVLAMTPLCTLQTLTSLKRFGATSMCSVLILGFCILLRSTQCNLLTEHADNEAWGKWTDSFRLWPESWWDLLDAFPLYISCFVCHYNVPAVHNELRQPTIPRVRWWLHSTTWVATLFYLVMGVAGSAYGAKCTAAGQVQGNVLLDFDNSDPLLLVGRMCMAVTISLAFPMLTIPARDIVLRELRSHSRRRQQAQQVLTRDNENRVQAERQSQEALQEPLLQEGTIDEEAAQDGDEGIHTSGGEAEPEAPVSFSFGIRLIVAIALFWTAVALASVVDSIDTVWDLLGSSLSILLSVLIPAASFLVLTHPKRLFPGAQPPSTPSPENAPEHAPEPETSTTPRFQWDVVVHQCSRAVSWALILLFVPLMFLSTGNAVYHTFFEKSERCMTGCHA